MGDDESPAEGSVPAARGWYYQCTILRTLPIMMNPKQVFALVAVGCLAFVMACNKPPAPAPVDATSAQGANAATPPRVLRRVKAEFPKALWSKPGTVSVRAMVGIDGKVGETKVVSSPHPEL